MIVKEIRVYFTTPLLEFSDAANEVLQRGWTARGSDIESVRFSQSFEDEADFEKALEAVKAALGSGRYSKIEFGTVT